MKKIAVFLVVFVMSASVFATETKVPDNAPAAPVVLTAVSGYITDAVTGEALAGAAVEIENTNVRVFTDLEGKFTIDKLVAGTYNVKVKYISYEEKSMSKVRFEKNQSDLSIQLESK